MVQIKLYNKNSDKYLDLIVDERYLQHSLAYLDVKELGLDFYVNPSIDFDLAISYFNNILPLYYDGIAFEASFKDELSYLQFSQQLIDEYIMDKLAGEIANYLKSLDIKNNVNIGNEICKEINNFPSEVESEIVQRLTIKSLQYLVEKYPNKKWNWAYQGLSRNPSITPDFVEKHSELPWNWNELSKNPLITPDFVEKHIDENWHWGYDGLSSNPAITPDFVERYPIKPWYWGEGGLSSNPSITPEFVEKHINENWNWGSDGLSSNPAITSKFVDKHPNKPWNQSELRLSRISAMIQELIKKDTNKNWNWGYWNLSRDPSITADFVERNINENWNWGSNGLSSNSMTDIKFNTILEYLQYVNPNINC